MKQIILLIFILFNSICADDTFHAVRLGVLSHSTGPVSSGKEEGVDLHTEFLFNTKILKAYPAIGADINLNGDTSFLYSTLVWEGRFFKFLLLGVSLGLGVHDGELNEGSSDKRQLGTRILFREAVEIGWYLQDDLVLSFMYDHYSNSGLGSRPNKGNDNMGLRLSYYF